MNDGLLPLIRQTRILGLGLMLVFLGGSCTSSGTQPATIVAPCAHPAVTTPDLRSHLETKPATFTTDGSGLYLLVTDFEHGGIFDSKVGSSAAYFGLTTAPPSWDRQRSIVSNVVLQVSATENVPLRIELPAGHYWIWISRFVDVQLIGCTPNALTDVIASPPIDYFPSTSVLR